jgi:hypothetical protein
MKKIATILAATALFALVAGSAFAANQLRISQVYGGGGSASAGPTYNVDYIEIFNSGATAVNIGSWTVEYGSATGNWGSGANLIFTFPANTTIAPCGYLLVASTTPSAGGGALPLTPDFTFPLSASATGGKMGLFKAVNTNLACGSELAGTLVDKVAYGTANCSEVTAVGALSTTTGAVRGLGGMTDTDVNSADFVVTTGPVPHNSLSPTNPNCQVVPTIHNTWGQLKSIYR